MGKENSVSRKNMLIAASVIAVMVPALVFLSVRIMPEDRILGDHSSCRIYLCTLFRILSITVMDEDTQILSFNEDRRYNDEFDFEYDRDTGTYKISEEIGDQRWYLRMTDDHELRVSTDEDAPGTSWRVRRHDNSQYYFILNDKEDYALCMNDDTHASVMPLDISNGIMYMRLE